MAITVLRLGHRIIRDQRITTHVALTARAFGADGIIISGEKDDGVIDSITKVCEEFGGRFNIQYVKDWRRVIKEWRGIIVHLTMYGINLDDVVEVVKDARVHSDLLIVVGGSKVPPEVYDWADYNIAIGNQPHSEVAAVAVFLYTIMDKNEINARFDNAKKEVVPSERGKNVIEKNG